MDAGRTGLAGEAGFHFARRLITRPAMTGTEDHDSCDEAGFRAIAAGGGLALSWQAHGLSYGLRSAAFLDGPKLVNLSRRILPQAVAALPGLRVIHVFARPEVLAQRLAARGREDADQIAARIARDTGALPAGLDIIHIDNSTTIEAATTAFLAALETVHI